MLMGSGQHAGACASQPFPSSNAGVFNGMQNKVPRKAIIQCLWKAVLCLSRMSAQEGSGKTF